MNKLKLRTYYTFIRSCDTLIYIWRTSLGLDLAPLQIFICVENFPDLDKKPYLSLPHAIPGIFPAFS